MYVCKCVCLSNIFQILKLKKNHAILYFFVGMAVFLKNISFHGILLDALFEDDNQDWLEVSQLLTKGIQSGAVRPLKSTVFSNTQVEEAFRFMAQGKHIGKVLIKVNRYKFIHVLWYQFFHGLRKIVFL